MDRTLLILLTVLLVVLNGFFVAAEFALVKVRMRRLQRMADEGVIFSKQAIWLAERLDNALSVCQIGITMASLGLGWVGEPAIARLLEPMFHTMGVMSETVVHTVSFVIAFSLITAAHLLVGEQVPKILAIRRPEPLSVWCAVPLRGFYIALYPLMVLLSASTSIMLKAFGVSGSADHDQVHSAEELQLMVSDAHTHGGMSRAKHRLIDAAFDFDETIAREIMVPRVEVNFFDVEQPLSAAFATVKATQHTRYPVCEGSLDHVLGFVHLKDLFGVGPNDDVDLKQVMRPAIFVPETVHINKLLVHFQSTKQHIAFVVDEFGTVSGLVTLENVLERIVGAVQDEFDLETPPVVRDGPGRFLVQGGMALTDLCDELGLEWTSREVSTVSGFLTERLGRVPTEGDTLELDGASIEVITRDGLRATTLRITVDSANGDDNGPG